MLKLLCFDTETTGLNPGEHEIIQLSGAICTGETAGSLEPRAWFDLRARPDHPEAAEPEALAVHGYSLEQLAEFPERKTMFRALVNLFDQHVNKFDKTDKFQPFGYNVEFDMQHLNSFARIYEPKYGLGSYISWHKLDVLARLNWKLLTTGQSVESRKLSAMCELHGIPIQAHDSLSDIRATMELANELKFCRFTCGLEPFDVLRNWE